MAVRTFLYQSIFNMAFVPVVAAPPVAGFKGEDSPVVVQQNVVYQSQFSAPLGPSTTPQGWMFQSPALFAKPFPISLQRFPDFEPLGTIAATAPVTVGAYFQWPDLFVKPAAVTKLQLAGFVTAPISAPQGWWTPSPAVFVTPYPAALQRFPDFAPQGQLGTTPQGWWAPSPALFVKPLPAALQRFPDFVPQGDIAVVTPVTLGAYFQWPERFIKPVPAALQRFPDFVPLGTIVSVTPYGWWGQTPALFVLPVSLAKQQFAGFTSSPVSAPSGWWGLSPVLFGKPMPVALQRFGDVVPQAPSAAVATIVAGFRGDDSPVTVTLNVVYQSRFSSPLGPTATPQGWWTPWPALFVKPVSVVKQQFAGFVQLPPAGAVSLTANWWSQWPALFAKPFPANLQRVADFPPRGTVALPPATAQGWWGQSPVLFIPSFPVKLQQFSGFFARIPDAFFPQGEGLKDEILRVDRLMNSIVRVTYLKNERLRMTSLQGATVRVSFLTNEQIRTTKL